MQLARGQAEAACRPSLTSVYDYIALSGASQLWQPIRRSTASSIADAARLSFHYHCSCKLHGACQPGPYSATCRLVAICCLLMLCSSLSERQTAAGLRFACVIEAESGCCT